ncbi:MAG TPA: radical SAM protein [Thermoanaerobaculia bacterium]|nr:radical SAM protein [Thermoanaerobaculia bacterium]
MDVTRSRIVMWELTRACKLSCIHCPVGSLPRRSPVELSTYEAYKTIDQIVSLQPDELMITGGDPLERTDIYQLIDYARRRGIAPSMMASGTPLLTGAAVGKLKRNGLARLIVSLDSSAPDRHDAVRGLTGQFSATLMSIRWARTAELPVEVNTLASRRNIADLAPIASLLGDVGAQRWNIYFLVPFGESKQSELLSGSELDEVFTQLRDISHRVAFPIRVFEAPHYRYFGKNDILFITHTGEVSISPFLPMTAGNVRYEPLTSLYRHGDMFTALRDEANLKGKCARCEYRKSCGGSRARAYAMTGDVFAADPLCNYQPGAAASTVPEVAAGRGSA